MKAQWKVHTPLLLKEIGSNPGMGILKQPLNIFANLLAQVAARAIAINDFEMNGLMLRLVLYEQGDPSSKDYDPSLLEQDAPADRPTLSADEAHAIIAFDYGASNDIDIDHLVAFAGGTVVCYTVRGRPNSANPKRRTSRVMFVNSDGAVRIDGIARS